METKHHFSDSVYANEFRMASGESIGKHVHPYSHLSILSFGQVMVRAGAETRTHIAPACLNIAAGVEHEVIAVTDAVWYCIHNREAG